jgi:PHP family Zn ribbon phosphoesterase
MQADAFLCTQIKTKGSQVDIVVILPSIENISELINILGKTYEAVLRAA